MLVGRVLRLPEAAAEARDGRGHRGARERQPVIIWFLSGAGPGLALALETRCG